MFSSNYTASTYNIHTLTSTCTTHPVLPSSLPSTNTKHSWQNGTRCRDGVNVLWCRSHLVWLVFEGSIPTCACFHLETFFCCFRCYYCCIGLCMDHCRQQRNSFRSSVVRKFKPIAPPTGCGILAQPNRNLKNTFRVRDLLMKPRAEAIYSLSVLDF